MAKIKIRGRKEAITIEDDRARQIKVLRFGNSDGIGKADPHDDLDLGDEWAGMLGQVDWIELDRKPEVMKTKAVEIKETRMVKIVPLDYTLQENEELI